jgi:threonine/homoserine/homoserine lactone efflux protein
MNSPLLLLLIQVLVLVGLLRLAWLGVRWLWRRSTRRKQAAATASEAG